MTTITTKPAGVVPEPGIYRNVPMAEYLAWRALNNSLINQAFTSNGEISMAHLRAAIDLGPKPATDPMMFGILAHTGRLEPLKLMSRYVVMPAFEQSDENKTAKGERTQSKATSYYKGKVVEFERVNVGKQCVEQAEFDRMLSILEALQRHPKARECFECDGETELSIVWQDSDTGVLCKARIDKVAHSLKALPDLKTCADMAAFNKSIWNYGYHRQQPFYADGYLAVTGKQYQPWLVAVESEQPHRVCAAPMAQEFIAIGRRQYKSVLSEYQKAEDSGVWPFPPDPESWEPPAWADPAKVAIS